VTFQYQPKIVRPQTASGIVLLRGQGKQLEVLLGRRSAQLRFMPGYYVFPGGRLDPADRKPSGFPEPPAEDLAAEADGMTRRLLAALRRAALRELWEETGLLLAEGPTTRHLQDQAADLPRAVWEHYRAHAATPAFGALRLIARAITPTWSPVRFHSRFFLCHTDQLTLHGQLAGDGELEDLRWQPVAETTPLPMADVTRAVLDQALISLRNPDSRPCLFLYRRGEIRRR
jgi:8-oxo-dGTP pyrophosphatase MutT (NUDIX family)